MLLEKLKNIKPKQVNHNMVIFIWVVYSLLMLFYLGYRNAWLSTICGKF